MSLLVGADDVTMKFADRTIFSQISFRLEQGKILLLTGPNGTGKSTLIKLILGKKKASSGTLRLEVPLDQIAYLPQVQNIKFALPMTIEDVLFLDQQKSTLVQQVHDIGLLTTDHLKRQWNEASGGEKQRTLITRAILKKPKLLILDEPFNHLDTESRRLALQQIEWYLENAANQAACILVGHDAVTDWAMDASRYLRLDLSQGS